MAVLSIQTVKKHLTTNPKPCLKLHSMAFCAVSFCFSVTINWQAREKAPFFFKSYTGHPYICCKYQYLISHLSMTCSY